MNDQFSLFSFQFFFLLRDAMHLSAWIYCSNNLHNNLGQCRWPKTETTEKEERNTKRKQIKISISCLAEFIDPIPVSKRLHFSSGRNSTWHQNKMGHRFLEYQEIQGRNHFYNFIQFRPRVFDSPLLVVDDASCWFFTEKVNQFGVYHCLTLNYCISW